MKKSLKCFFYFAACFLMLFLMIPQKVLAIEPEPTQVDEIKFKVDIPIVGQEAGKLGYAIKEETEGIFCTDGLTGINDTSTAWFVKNGSKWEYFPEGSTFENGKEYGIRFALGYNQFNYKITDTAKAYVNEKSAELTYHTSTYSGNGYVVFYSFGVLDKDKVYGITVDGGYAKNYSTGIKVTEAKAGQRIELVAEAPDKDHGIWYWDGDGVPSAAAAEAVTNHFTFIMPAHDVDVKAVWGKLIKNAGCTITNPVAGKEVDKAPVSWEPDKYSVSYSNLTGTSDSGKLIEGNHYEYVVEFIPEPGYVLDMLCDYSVNDSSAFCGGVGIFADGTRRFSVYEKYEFYAHDDSATEINKIVINGITPPAVGEQITKPSLTPGTEGYEIVKAVWYGYAITDNYTGYSSGDWLGENFKDKTVYVLDVAVQPKEGYYFNRFITNISADNMLLTVEPGSVVEWNVGTALPYDVMKLVKEKDITLIFSYTYENNDYVVKITKDNVPKQVVPWYGPKFLAGLSGRTVTLSGNVYTVVAGDTLSMIAARFNTTVDEILKKNPQIDNPDYIYVGQQISL